MRALRLPPLLKDRAFRRYFAGATVSQFGDRISGIAVPLTAVLALHAGAAQMGYLTATGLVPFLLLSIHVGIFVDRRGRRRRLMIAADIGRALLLATIPAAFLLGRLTMAQLYIVAFGAGTLTLAFQVANSALFTAIVTEERYVEANALLNGSRAVSMLGGPSIGGMLVQALSAPLAILADAVSFLGSAAALLRIAPQEPPPAPARRGDTLTGLRYLWRSPTLRPSMLAVTTINLFNYIFSALFVLYATRALHVAPAALGLVFGTGAVGAIAGALGAGRIGRRIGIGAMLLLGTVLFPAPLVLVPLAGGAGTEVFLYLVLAELGSGFGVMLLDIGFGSLAAAAVPDEIRARVMGAFAAVNYGIRPIGALLGGFLPAAIGLHGTLWLGAVGALLGVLWLLPSPVPSIRQVDDQATRATEP